jgi:hypothetical protein
MGPGPLQLGLVGGRRGHELGAWSAVEEVQRVALAHASEAGAGDFELLDGHRECGRVKRSERERLSAN